MLFFNTKKKIFYSFAVLLKVDARVAELVDLSADRQARFDEILAMVWVYAISSLNYNYIYVGMSINVNERIERHNSRRERTTRHYAPFRLIYVEKCADRIEARKREKYWKSGVGKERLRKIKNNQ